MYKREVGPFLKHVCRPPYFWFQCDGSSLELNKGPALQGVALLNIPYAHGGSNLWGSSGAHRRGRFPNAQQGNNFTEVNVEEFVLASIPAILGFQFVNIHFVIVFLKSTHMKKILKRRHVFTIKKQLNDLMIFFNQ